MSVRKPHLDNKIGAYGYGLYQEEIDEYLESDDEYRETHQVRL